MSADIINDVFDIVYPAKLARKLSEHTGKTIHRQTVHQRMQINRTIPPEWVIGIEKATHGLITRQKLRPDLYPPGE